MVKSNIWINDTMLNWLTGNIKLEHFQELEILLKFLEEISRTFQNAKFQAGFN